MRGVHCSSQCWYSAPICALKCAARLLRLILSVGVIKEFSVVHASSVSSTARGWAYCGKPRVSDLILSNAAVRAVLSCRLAGADVSSCKLAASCVHKAGFNTTVQAMKCRLSPKT